MGRQIGKGDTLLGVPLLKARNVLRAWRDGSSRNATEIRTRKDVQLDAPVVAMLLQEFQDRGLIGPEKVGVATVIEGLTPEGIAFVTASGRRRTPRAKAQAVLDAFIDRCGVVNDSKDAPLQVDKVWLYGSMIREEEDVGDIDLDITCRWAPSFATLPDHERHEAAEAKALAMLDRADRARLPFRAAAPSAVFDRMLHGARRHPLVSVGDADALVQLACPCKLVFDAAQGGRISDGPVLDRHPEAGDRHPDVGPPPGIPDLGPAPSPILPIHADHVPDVELNHVRNTDIGGYDAESDEFYELVLLPLSGDMYASAKDVRAEFRRTAATAHLMDAALDRRALTGAVLAHRHQEAGEKADAGALIRRSITEGPDGYAYAFGVDMRGDRMLGTVEMAALMLPVMVLAGADVVRLLRRSDEAGHPLPVDVEVTVEGKGPIDDLREFMGQALSRPESWLGRIGPEHLDRIRLNAPGLGIEAVVGPGLRP